MNLRQNFLAIGIASLVLSSLGSPAFTQTSVPGPAHSYAELQNEAGEGVPHVPAFSYTLADQIPVLAYYAFEFGTEPRAIDGCFIKYNIVSDRNAPETPYRAGLVFSGLSAFVIKQAPEQIVMTHIGDQEKLFFAFPKDCNRPVNLASASVDFINQSQDMFTVAAEEVGRENVPTAEIPLVEPNWQDGSELLRDTLNAAIASKCDPNLWQKAGTLSWELWRRSDQEAQQSGWTGYIYLRFASRLNGAASDGSGDTGISQEMRDSLSADKTDLFEKIADFWWKNGPC